MEPNSVPESHPNSDGMYKEIYTLTGNERIGHDNFGHNIPELLPVLNACITTTSSQQQLTASDLNMTPIASGPRLGRKVTIGLDVLIQVIIVICLLSVEFGVFPHVQTGFYCNDPSISFKLKGEIISTMVILLSVFIPFFILWLTEALFYKCVSLKSTRTRKSFSEAIYWFKKYFIGMIMHLLVVEVLKVVVGEQRPHFLNTCRPDTAINCTTNEYITNYLCTNKVDSLLNVRDSSKSFPSGHASISFYEAIFLICYLYVKVPQPRSQIILPFFQTLLITWACFVSATRVTDHRHHWWDVLCGAVIGIVFSILTVTFLCRRFKRKPESCILHQNGHINNDRHTSVRRLLSDVSTKDEVTMNHVVVA